MLVSGTPTMSYIIITRKRGMLCNMALRNTRGGIIKPNNIEN
jgi:hypothetical protein